MGQGQEEGILHLNEVGIFDSRVHWIALVALAFRRFKA